MTRLIFIDSRVPDVSSIIATLTADTESIVFDYYLDTMETLKSKITKSYDSVAIAQHKYGLPEFQLVASMLPAQLANVETVDPELTSWSDFIGFLEVVQGVAEGRSKSAIFDEENHTGTIDLLACDLWKDDNWKYAILKMEEKTGLDIRASIDMTGIDGNFVLESDGVDMVGIYFTPEILQYKYNFNYVTFSGSYYNAYKNYSPIFFPTNNPGVVSANAYAGFLGKAVDGGNTGYGSTKGIYTDISNVANVVANEGAAAVLKTDGTVVSFGAILYGGDCTWIQSELYNITKIIPIYYGFVALRSDGKIFPWGEQISLFGSKGYNPAITSFPSGYAIHEHTLYRDVSQNFVNIVDVYQANSRVMCLTNTGKIVSFGTTRNSTLDELNTTFGSKLSSGVVKVIIDAASAIYVKSDGTAYGGGYLNGIGSVIDVYHMAHYPFVLRKSGKATQLVNYNASKIFYTIPEGVFVVKTAAREAANLIIVLLSNNVLLLIVAESTNPVIINNVSEFVANEHTYAYIQNGQVFATGQTFAGSNYTDVNYGIPGMTAGTPLTNVRQLFNTADSIGAITFDNKFVWWGRIRGSGPVAFRNINATNLALSNKIATTNVSSVYATNKGYVISFMDGTLASIGITDFNGGNEAVSQYGTKTSNQNVMFIPAANGVVPVELAPFDSATLTQNTQYTKTTVSYYNSNPDIMPIKGRKYSLYFGETKMSSYYCDADSFTHTFANAIFTEKGSVSVSVYDTPDFTTSKKLLATFSVNVAENPSVSEPDAPAITSVAIGVKTLTINFTAPDWNGGTEIVGYKYSINRGVSYTVIPSIVAPIVISNLEGPDYTFWLKTVTYVGESYQAERVVQMYTIPSAPTVLSSVVGDRQLTLVVKSATNGGNEISKFRYKLSTEPEYTDVTTNPRANMAYYYRFNVDDVSGNTIRNHAAATPTYDAILRNAAITTVLYARGNSCLVLSPGGSNGNPYLELPPITFGSSGITIGYWVYESKIGYPLNSYENGSNSGPLRFTGYNSPTIDTPNDAILFNDGTLTITKSGASYSKYMYPTGFNGRLYPAVVTTPDFLYNTSSRDAFTFKHCMIVIDPNYWKFYYNGVLINTITSGIAYPNVEYPRYQSYFGRGTQRTLNGVADDIVIFNRSLESHEIFDVYNDSFNSAKFTIPNLLNGSTYSVDLRTTNGAGNSATTTHGPVSLGKVVPFAPVITSTIPGDTTAKIVFTRPYNGGEVITGYKYSINNSVVDSSYISLGLIDSSFVLTGLTNGTSYTVKMKATNLLGDSPESVVSASFIPRTLPGAPSIQSVSVGNQTATVSFSAPESTGGLAITQYRYRLNGGTSVPLEYQEEVIEGSLVPRLSFVLTGLANGTSYTIRLTTMTVAGESALSVASSTFIPSTTPDIPIITSVSKRNQGASVSFTISNGGSVITELQYSLNDASYIPVSVMTSPLVLSELTNGETYRVKLLAGNANGASPESEVSPEFVPMTTPDAPVITSVQPGNSSISVEFTDGSYNGSSPVIGYKYSVNGRAYQSIGMIQSPYSIQSGISNGTAYAVKFKSVNSEGDSPESVVSETVIPFTSPNAPTIGVITNGDKYATIAVVVGNNGGYPFVSHSYSVNDGESTEVLSLSTLVFPGLEIGTEYNFKIKSITSVGESTYVSARFVGMSVPDKPVITDIVARNNSAMVYFDKPASNESAITGYTYSVNGGASVPVVFYDASSFLVSGLLANMEYTVSMKATNAIGVSPISDGLTVVPYTYPVAPAIDTIDVDNGSAQISYTAQSSNSSPITGYTYSLNNGSYQPVPTPLLEPFLLTDLSNGVAYTLRMKAVNAAGASQTPSVEQFMPRTVPEAPTILSVTAGNRSCEVEFRAGFFNGSQITKYQYSFNGTDFEDAAGTVSPITIPGLVNGNTYMIYLLASNVIGDSNISAPSSAFVPFVTQSTPSPPTITSVVPGDEMVEIAFDAGENTGSAIKGYRFSTDNGVSSKWAEQTESPLRITGLTNGTPYTFLLYAVNNSGFSEPSLASATVIPSTVPTKPYIIGVQPGNQDITVSFVPSDFNGAEAVGYMYSVNGGDYFLFADETATIYGLTNGTSYVVRIRAVNTIGMSEASFPSVAVIPFSTPDKPVINQTESMDQRIKVHFTPGASNGSVVSYYEYALSVNGAQTPFATAPSNESPFEIAGLTNGVSYHVRMRAVSTLNARSALSVQSDALVPRGVPTKPVITTVSPGNGALSVHYVSSSNGADITSVLYSVGSGVFMELSGNVSSFVIPDLVNGATYNIKMKAVNVAGSSDESNVYVDAIPFSVADSPTILSATPGDSTIHLAITPGNTNGSTFLGYKYSVNDLPYGWVDGVDSPLRIAGLTNGTSYIVKLRAFSEKVGLSLESNASASVMPYRSLDAPIIQSVLSGDGSATVVFANGDTNGLVISGYKYSIDGETYVDVSANTVDNKLQLVIPGLVNGNTYTARILATTATPNGNSLSSVVSAPFMPYANPGKPIIEKIITGNQTASIYIIDGSLNGSGNIESYQYSYDAFATPGIVTSGISPIVITSGLINAQAYRIQVRTKTVKGLSVSSNQSALFVPYTLPGAPAITGVVAGNGVAEISYTDGATNGRPLTKYQYSLNGATYVDASASSPILLSGLTNGVSYAVSLKSVNLAGSSPASLLSSVFVPFTIPAAPAITNVVASAGQATVYVAPGNNNGSVILKYSYSLNGAAYVSTADAATAFTITGLTNGTTYSIAVKAENAAGLSGASTAYTGVVPFTTPNPPTVTSATIGNGSAIIYITNGANNGRTITQYQYTYTTGTTSTTLTTVSSTTQLSSFVITGLTNWLYYTVNVKAVNLAGASVASVESAPFRPFAIPGAPVIASVVPGNASLTVNLDGLTVGAGVVGYRYSFDGTNYTYQSGGGSTFVITEGIVNAKPYVVKVKSVTENGDSPASVAYTPVVPFAVPNYPNITSVVPGDKTVSIYVVDGSNNGSEIIAYEHSADGVNYTVVDAVSPIVLSNLDNWVPYAFRLKAVNAAGRSQPSPPSTEVVPFLVPTSASIASLTPGDSQLTVNMAGYTADSGIIGYKYSFDASGYTYVPSPSASFVVSGLKNGQTYRLYAKSVTTAGESPASTLSAPEYPRAPPSPPTDVVVTPLNESASISFLDGSSNGAPVEYYIYSVNNEIDVPIKIRDDGTLRIFGLANATENTLRLRAVNNAGPSAYSVASNLFIPYGSPSTPVISKIMPGNNMVYVHFNPIDANGAPLTAFKYSLGGSLIDVSGLTSPLTIPGLVNKTTYTISIVASNAGGNSNNSVGLPITVGVPDAPVITSVVENNKRLLVYFDVPGDNGNPISGYMFGYKGATALSKALYLNSTSVSPIQIVNLKNGTPYEPYLCAVNKNGNSVPSNTVDAKIPRDVPAKIVVSSVSPGMNNAAVYFAAPPNNGAPILKYKYALNANTDFIEVDASGLVLPLRITGIPVNSAFTVKVIATNAAGDSLVSLPSKPTTYTYLPPAVVKVSGITMPTRNSLSVAFVPPAINGSAITQYQYALNTDTVFRDASGLTPPLLITDGIVPNTPYNVRIIAVNDAGSSAPSAPVAKPVSVVYLPPLAPAVASIIPGNASALVTFTAPVPRGAPITGYVYSYDSAGLVFQDISGGTVSPLLITELTNDTLYNMRIAAVTEAGYSALSIAKAVTPVFKEPGVPIVATVVAGSGMLTVNFTAPVANGSPIIEYKYTLNGGPKITAVVASTGKSLVITKDVVDDVEVPLVAGKVYSVQICATNSIGDSALSAGKPGTPKV